MSREIPRRIAGGIIVGFFRIILGGIAGGISAKVSGETSGMPVKSQENHNEEISGGIHEGIPRAFTGRIDRGIPWNPHGEGLEEIPGGSILDNTKTAQNDVS